MPNKLLIFLKKNALFICMITGIVFYEYIARLSFIAPYCLFLMLLITYCRISFRSIRAEPLYLWLSSIQISGCLLVYFLLKPVNPYLAQGCMLCMLAPAATSSPVIVGLLGGSITSMAAYSIISNVSTAFIAPAIFSAFGAHGLTGDESISFILSFLIICAKVMPLLIGPFVLALVLKIASPKIYGQLRNRQIYSFWLWAVALTVVVAKTTSDLIGMIEKDNAGLMLTFWILLGALVICLIQFTVGRFFGKKYDNKIVGGQGLGQKNTILAIWMAQTFFNPLAAIAPASYVIWQNLINSYQLWKYGRKATSNE